MKKFKLKESAVMAVAAFSLSLSTWAYDLEENGLYFTIMPDQEGCVEVSASDDSRGIITVPPYVTIDGNSYKVTKIGVDALARRHMTTVDLPNTITTLAQGALRWCVKMKHIKLPSSLKSIGRWTFDKSRLKSVVIPNEVDTINWLFDESRDLERIVLGKGVKVLTGFVFSDVYDIKELYVMSPEPPEIPAGEEPFYKTWSTTGTIYVPAECLDKYPRREEGEENLHDNGGVYSRVFDGSWKFFTDFRPIPDLFIVLNEVAYEVAVGDSVEIIYDTVNYADVDVYSEKWEYDPEMVDIEGDTVTAIALGETTVRRVVETSTGVYKSHDIKMTLTDPAGVTLPTVDPDQSEPAGSINAEGSSIFYGIDGMPAGGNPDKLRPGVYIERRGNKTTKFIKR